MFLFIEQILFPKSCIGCGRKDRALCTSCRAILTPRHIRAKTEIDCISAFPYNNPVVRKAILAWKYRGNPDAGTVLLTGFHTMLQTMPAPRDALIVPIPTRRKRNNRRGFAPPEALAAVATKALHLPTCNALAYTRKTRQQAGLPLAKRLKNMHNAFVVAQENILRERSVILVDDIITTGATLSAAAHALRKKGTTDIHAITLAWNP